ncbi:hypothetical protein HYR54_13230 [Candidatus Acetothermia bacterium]|nr:hypothetical protein [Candidatus Acetothermia bacterium]
MGDVDKRNQLDEEVFSCRMTKDQKVFIYWRGKQAQLVMARMTGNFKRGNERKKSTSW